MPDSKGFTSENPRHDGAPGEKKKNVDGVVDELRNVLSGLSQGKSSAEPFPRPDPSFRPASGFPDAPAPTKPPAEGTPSDAEFWNGNVLGWPSESGAADATADPYLTADSPLGPADLGDPMNGTETE